MTKLIGILCSLFIFLVGCGRSDSYSSLNKTSSVYLFGNSLLAFHDHGVSRWLSVFNPQVNFTDRSYVGALAEAVKMQYADEIRKGNYIETLVVEGGANNVFLHAWWCWDKVSEECKRVIEYAIGEIGDLISRAKKNGTKKIILLLPYHLINRAASFNAALDYSIPFWLDICVRIEGCTVLDLREHFVKKSLFWIDGVHPSLEGSFLLAKLISDELQN